MDKNSVVLIVAIICLTILGIAFTATQADASKIIYAICGVIGAIAGVGIPPIAMKITHRLKRGGRWA